MSIKLVEGATPSLTIGKKVFLDRIEDGYYEGEIPMDFFDVGYRDVYINEDFAQKLDWYIDEEMDGAATNLAAYSQTVTLYGETVNIGAGMFCSYVDYEEVVRDNE